MAKNIPDLWRDYLLRFVELQLRNKKHGRSNNKRIYLRDES